MSLSNGEFRLPVDVRPIWGKLGNGSRPHPLICHALDTAEVASQLFDLCLGPYLKNRLEAALEPLGDAREWAARLAGLHDLGKCSPTFQGLRADVAKTLLPESDHAAIDRLREGQRSPGARTDVAHGLISALYVRKQLVKWGASAETAESIGVALGAHHGYVPGPADLRQISYKRGAIGGETWATRVEELADELCRLRRTPEGEPSAADWARVMMDGPAELALAALTSVSDWVASDRREEAHAGAGVDLTAYAAGVVATEQPKVKSLGWEACTVPEDTSFGSLFPQSSERRDLQTRLEQLVAGERGLGVFLLSAPTGEGKTKAALQAAACMIRLHHLRGFHVAMPTRASGNQAYEVAAELLRPWDGHAMGRLKLFHGAAGEYLNRRSAAGPPPLCPECVAEDGGRGASDQFGCDSDAQAKAQLSSKADHLNPLVVSTVDQVLKAAVRSGHVFVRLAGLSGKVIIFDEVHGYDVHSGVLFETLLYRLGGLRTPVVLLSATLSTRQQHALVNSWRAGALGLSVGELPGPEVPGTAAYPRILSADVSVGGTVSAVGVTAAPVNRDRVVQLHWVDRQDVVELALREARRGRNVAIVHNLVGEAKKDWELLRRAVGDLAGQTVVAELIHGRLDPAERLAAEGRLRARFGPRGSMTAAPGSGGSVVIGTMVLESSLDLDFDVMISAVAPIDSLIQRMGRIGRHRVGAERPEIRFVLIRVPEPRSGRKAVNFGYAVNVYDEAILLRTLAVLRERDVIRCPDEVQELLDRVYDDGEKLRSPLGWEEQWERAAARSERGTPKAGREALTARIPMSPGTRWGLRTLTEFGRAGTATRQSGHRADRDRKA
ncbi:MULTISPECIES: CRISPR-associated helicase Cas3' [unclassified Streptomyces]|uniref:CRISPR-associated helicase Cas3' n=1 Tax=unclassified Streptomyces TaxID=2593676 RepID=UPI00081E191D|nr:CRISPR-associated helicase Cas3' [Streptomyces sp. ScaeMP-e83]MYR95254.1 CRISPR-associated helicase Cas3' [Streptomyces sp. SID4937]SCD86597.1 CRISPR-associated endonuclease/helicase Cas3 [Streptomyces sp. ScaeMP-e83]